MTDKNHMTDEDLLKLCEAATPGPWKATGPYETDELGPPRWYVSGADPSYEATLCELWSGEHDNRANAAFIAAAREAIPRLLVQKERLRNIITATQRVLDGQSGAIAELDRATREYAALEHGGE